MQEEEEQFVPIQVLLKSLAADYRERTNDEITELLEKQVAAFEDLKYWKSTSTDFKVAQEVMIPYILEHIKTLQKSIADRDALLIACQDNEMS